MSERLLVELGKRSYEIHIASGLLEEAGNYVRVPHENTRTITITDENVAPQHLGKLEDSLAKAGVENNSIVLPAGEAAKSFEVLQRLIDEIYQFNPERSVKLIALGGGVIGDLVGFCASILLRGVEFIQIPTSLLAQVDSSVGGKTGINIAQGKNLIGSFYQPKTVLIDTATLQTLPERHLRAGYAEIVKYGLIGDAEFFQYCQENYADILALDEQKLVYAIKTSTEKKAQIVAEDEKEKGKRALLNLGHTFGHALENLCGYSDELFHGEAVAIGICLAYSLAAEMKLCTAQEAEEVAAHFADAGLRTKISEINGLSATADEVAALFIKDKKVSDGKVNFILPRGIGNAFITNEIDNAALHKILEDSING